MGTVAAAVNQVLRAHLSQPQGVLLGDSVGRGGGVSGTSAGLADHFGADRVVDLPIADRAALGFALGLALSGRHPVVELSASGRLAAGLEVLLDAADLAHRGQPLPLVVRVPCGGQAGPQLDRGLLAQLCAHPGLRVLSASVATPAGGLLAAALECQAPVVLFEPRSLYDTVNAESSVVSLGARVLRRGARASVWSWGDGVSAALDCDEDVDVIDLVSLSPLDLGSLGPALRRHGRLLVAAPSDLPFAQGLLRYALSEAFWSLEAPPQVVRAEAGAIREGLAAMVG